MQYRGLIHALIIQKQQLILCCVQAISTSTGSTVTSIDAINDWKEEQEWEYECASEWGEECQWIE